MYSGDWGVGHYTSSLSMRFQFIIHIVVHKECIRMDDDRISADVCLQKPSTIKGSI